MVLPKDPTKIAAYKERIRQTRLGTHASEETKLKMSASRSGERNPFYGKHHNPDAIEKNRSAHTGKIHTQSTRDKMVESQKRRYQERPELREILSERNIGSGNPNFGKPISDEQKLKLSAAKIGDRHPNYGKNLPLETRLKIRETHKGDRCYNWKGGITKLNHAIRQLMQCREWSASVFKRDDYVCQDCKKRSGVLEAHHIVPFHQIVKDYNIQTVEDAIACEFLWDLSNGVTLCRRCHKKLHKSDPEKECLPYIIQRRALGGTAIMSCQSGPSSSGSLRRRRLPFRRRGCS